LFFILTIEYNIIIYYARVGTPVTDAVGCTQLLLYGRWETDHRCYYYLMVLTLEFAHAFTNMYSTSFWTGDAKRERERATNDNSRLAVRQVCVGQITVSPSEYYYTQGPWFLSVIVISKPAAPLATTPWARCYIVYTVVYAFVYTI
jgi:hypothetical protein